MLEQVRRQVYAYSGIQISPDRDYYLRRVLERRLRALAIDDFRDYFRCLALDDSGEEFSRLIEGVTVNETYFFRDYPQLSGFAEEVLPRLIDEKLAKGNRVLRMLSAGCSTGEEPYTLAIICREILDNPETWQLDIAGIDINTCVLEKARAGRYDTRSTRDVPISYKSKYFDMTDSSSLVREPIRSDVHFDHGNIMDEGSLLPYAGMDVVFCRNVLIYFDDESRRRALHGLYHCLNPGGFVFLGYAESVGRFTGAFEMTRINGFLGYRRPQ